MVVKRGRIESFDILKSIAIFLVVWCHVLQFWGHHLFDYTFTTVVYSFHMPVFMIIAGYLFEPKLHKGIVEMGIQRFERLIIPSVAGGLIVLLYTAFHKSIGLYDILHLPFYCWFLSSLFFCCILYSLLSRIFKEHVIAETVVLSLIVLFLPGAEYLKYMVPFFGVGICLSKAGALDKIESYPWAIVMTLISIVLLLFVWSPEYTIYKTQCPSLHSFSRFAPWKAYFIRLITGTCITISLMGIAAHIKLSTRVKKTVLLISNSTLGLYLFQSIVFDCTKDHISLPDWGIFGMMGISFIISVLLVAVLELIIVIVRKNKISARILLGEKN